MDITYLYTFGLAVRNARRMLQDRGYTVDQLNQDPYAIASKAYATAKSTNCSLGESVRAIYKHSKVQGRTIGLWCLDRNFDPLKNRDRMISTDQIKVLYDILSESGTTENIVLCPNKLSPQAKRESFKNTTLFQFDELLIDLPRHELVPEHRRISEENVKDVLGQSLNIRDLPQLPTSDPVARWFNFEIGSIIFIDNPTMPTFRVVVR